MSYLGSQQENPQDWHLAVLTLPPAKEWEELFLVRKIVCYKGFSVARSG